MGMTVNRIAPACSIMSSFSCCICYNFIHACTCVLLIVLCVSREHLSEEDLRKNKALLEGLTKGQLVDNPEVM